MILGPTARLYPNIHGMSTGKINLLGNGVDKQSAVVVKWRHESNNAGNIEDTAVKNGEAAYTCFAVIWNSREFFVTSGALHEVIITVQSKFLSALSAGFRLLPRYCPPDHRFFQGIPTLSAYTGSRFLP